MNAQDIVNELRTRFTCVQGFHTARCQTGDLYRTFESRAPVDGEDTASHNVLAMVNAYAAEWQAQHVGAHPTLFWRYDKPHIFWYPDDEPRNTHPGCLRTRLVITDRPVVWDTIEAYDAFRTGQLETEIVGAGKPWPPTQTIAT